MPAPDGCLWAVSRPVRSLASLRLTGATRSRRTQHAAREDDRQLNRAAHAKPRNRDGRRPKRRDGGFPVSCRAAAAAVGRSLPANGAGVVAVRSRPTAPGCHRPRSRRPLGGALTGPHDVQGAEPAPRALRHRPPRRVGQPRPTRNGHRALRFGLLAAVAEAVRWPDAHDILAVFTGQVRPVAHPRYLRTLQPAARGESCAGRDAAAPST